MLGFFKILVCGNCKIVGKICFLLGGGAKSQLNALDYFELNLNWAILIVF